MLARILKGAPIVVAMAAAAAWAFGWGGTPACAQCGCGRCQHGEDPAGHGDMGAMDMGSMGRQRGDAAGDRARPATPHGGQLTSAPPMNFEVVYLPQEIRVYLYGRMPYPASAKEVTGEVFLQRPYDERVTRLALRYVAQPADQQDYLAAPVDLSRVRRGELMATIKLANLPLQNRPGINFGQNVVVSRPGPQVTLAALGPSDEAGIARQRVCPVTGRPLGEMGEPVKVLIDGQPLYLCCKGCLAKVRNNPAAFLSRAVPQVTLAALDQSDEAGIARQRVCPVTGRPLGEMGEPVKVLIDGRPLYLCCKGCVAKVKRAPEAYLRTASQASRVQ